MTSVFDFVRSSLPQIQTSKALILVGLQNEFCLPDGRLCAAPDDAFYMRLETLVDAFRAHGHVIWVRSEYDTTISADQQGADAPSTYILGTQGIQSGSDFSLIDKELFLSAEPEGGPATILGSAGAQYVDRITHMVKPSDQHIIKHSYSTFRSTGMLNLLRTRFVSHVFVCGALTNISAYATSLDAARHGMRVTLVEDCLLYRERSRHEGAISTLIADYIANLRSVEEILADLEHPEVLNESGDDYDMADEDDFQPEAEQASIGVDLKTQAELETHCSPEHLTDTRLFPIPQHMTTDLEVDSDCEEEEIPMQILAPIRALSHRLRSLPFADTGQVRTQQRQRVATTPAHRTGQLDQKSATSTSAQDRQNHAEADRTCQDPSTRSDDSCRDISARSQNSWDAIFARDGHSSPSLFGGEMVSLSEVEEVIPNFRNKMEPKKQDVLGEGYDSLGSSIMYNLLDKRTANEIFEKLKSEVQWSRMLHQTGEVPRLVCCQGTIHPDGSMPVYRHPSDKTTLATEWTKSVDMIRQAAERSVGHELNHALIQLYRNGHDFISEHSDKTLDIVPGSNIVNVSFGAERSMRLRTKRTQGDGARTTHRIPMPHNSMLILSLPINAEYLHGIKADKRRQAELSEVEAAYDGQRISITFRQIGTFLSADTSAIWGQGAKAKSKQHAQPVVNGDEAESERLIHAFGTENQSSTYDWSGFYGDGSNVLHVR